MNKLITQLRALIARALESFSRLSEQEKAIVLGVAVVASTLGTVGLTFSIIRSIDRTQKQIVYKSDLLREIISMRETFRRNQDQSAAFRARLSRNDIRLSGLLEDQAKAMGVELGNLVPHSDSEVGSSGIKVQSVDVRAQKLSLDKLTTFLQKLEEQPNPVRVIKLKVQNRYDEKDLLDVEMTVSTYKST